MGALLVSSLLGLVVLIAAAAAFFRFGWKALYVAVPVAAGGIASAVVLGRAGSEFFTVMFLPLVIGGTAGLTFRFGWSLQAYVLITTISLTAAFSGDYYYLKQVKKVDLLEDSRRQIIDFMKVSEMSETEKADLMVKIDSSMKQLRELVPFSYFLNSLIVALLCFFIMRLTFQRRPDAQNAEVQGIEYFKLNDYCVFALIFGWLVVLVLDSGKYYPFYIAGLNCALCFSALYLMQAVGIVKFHLKKRGVPPFVLPMAIMGLFVLGIEVTLFFAVILLSIGALDFWADFRRLGARAKK